MLLGCSGEIKEKKAAHREYREAISKGHGAYLMDEEEPVSQSTKFHIEVDFIILQKIRRKKKIDCSCVWWNQEKLIASILHIGTKNKHLFRQIFGM